MAIHSYARHRTLPDAAIIGLVLAVFFILFPAPASAATVTFLISGTSWSVPSDWNNSNNTIEVIGGGGGGCSGATGSTGTDGSINGGGTGGSGGGGCGGGGGGAYSKSSNVALTASANVTIAVGAAGNSSGGAGGDTYLCNGTSNCASIAGSAVQVGAKGGSGGSVTAGGAGGAAASGFGTTKYSGGTAGNGAGGAGGYGPGGPNGYDGGNGGAGGNSGGAGGAAGKNGAGNAGSGTTAGSGDAGFGGAAGGGNGTEYDSSHGSGGGGSGASGGGGGAGGFGSGSGDECGPVFPGDPGTAGGGGGASGLYGAGGGGGSGGGGGGGGGGEYSTPGCSATGGAGAAGGSGSAGKAGLIVITYTPGAAAPTVSAINPSSGVNNGSVSLTTVTGTGFASGATVKLTKTGQSDISCTGVSFTNSTTLSSGSCPITSAATSNWNVVVTNTDTQSGTLTNGFYISAPGPQTVTFSNAMTINGTLSITAALSKGSGSFVIDHPLDPKNKLLYHSFVESPEPMDMYTGSVVLDTNGNATVTLPSYFLALNKDFKYFATPIGEPMPNLFLSIKVQKRFFGLFGAPVFAIAGGVPGGEVSWQVLGIRHDSYILANPIVPEVKKGPGAPYAQGMYVHPDVYTTSSKRTQKQ